MSTSRTAPVFEARLQTVGQFFDAPASVPLLESAQAAGVTMQSSCRNGTCRSCICRLVSGKVSYHIAWPGLSAEEKTEGYILPCVAYPASDLVIQAPAGQS